jgi:hypothetical protein
MKARFYLISCLLIFCSCKTSRKNSDNEEIQITEIEKHYLLSDSGSEKYYLIKLIRKLQSEKILGETPMLIVDGDPKFYFYKENAKLPNVEKNKIKSVKITKADKCVQLFGAACKYGLITIITYGEQEDLP